MMHDAGSMMQDTRFRSQESGVRMEIYSTRPFDEGHDRLSANVLSGTEKWMVKVFIPGFPITVRGND
jgi:hypothetical protein